MHRQLIVASFEIFDDEIARIVGRDLPFKILVQRMNRDDCVGNHSARGILYRAANASKSRLSPGSREKNEASKEQSCRQTKFGHRMPPSSRTDSSRRFVIQATCDR
jgi:hypothetical protein